MKILSIGSVVRLKQGERKLMVLNRFPLSNQNGVVGYFDYSGCLYPEGHISLDVFFFNSEDIAEVFFEGYILTKMRGSLEVFMKKKQHKFLTPK